MTRWNGRRVLFWGAGRMCNNYLENGLDIVPEYIIDNDKSKEGSFLYGIRIILPNKIDNWKKYFVIIVSQYEDEIKKQLQELGLCYQIDFSSIHELHMQPVQLETVKEAFVEFCFSGKEDYTEQEYIVRSKEEYEQLKSKFVETIEYEDLLNNIYYRLPGKLGSYRGYCSVCEKESDLIVDFFWSNTKWLLWRETVTCPYCNCNNRMRYVIDRVKHLYADKKVFVYEYVTVTYKALKKYVGNLVGSEYISDTLQSGEVQDGILHEDAMHLSFEDNSFDVMISNDVFEHVNDYKLALREAYRCLRTGGRFLISVPIFKDRKENIRRAQVNDEGEIEYLLEPQYHGNPLSEKGSLVYTEFGWDFLEDLRECGFKDAYAIVYFSVKRGHLGRMPICFEAVK